MWMEEIESIPIWSGKSWWFQCTESTDVYVIIYMAYNYLYLDIHERLLTRPSEVTDQMNQ